jgi:hypothetical protein
MREYAISQDPHRRPPNAAEKGAVLFRGRGAFLLPPWQQAGNGGKPAKWEPEALRWRVLILLELTGARERNRTADHLLTI